MVYDPLQPPDWVRQAMRDKSRRVRVNPNDGTLDAYLDDLATRAMADPTFRKAMALAMAATPKAPRKARKGKA